MSAAALSFQLIPPFRATLDSVPDHLRTHYRRLGQASRRRRFMSQTSPTAIDCIVDQATPDLILENAAVLHLICDAGWRSAFRTARLSPRSSVAVCSTELTPRGSQVIILRTDQPVQSEVISYLVSA